MPTSSSDPTTGRTQDLRSRIRGRVVEPAEPDYDAVRTVKLGGVDPRPALIARPLDDADVAAVVRFAREAGLPLAVRSGGHSGAAHGSVDGGVVIDLRDMKAVDIDPTTRTGWAEAGATASEVTAATATHGLAVGLGDTGSVGLSGITLGGGVGFLTRKLGLTIDNLIAADVVTADGAVLRADPNTHPDLFWAIRGGGGNFGVVTRFQFRLHEVDQVVGGILILPATAETVAGFITAAEDAPDELTTIANVMPCPPMPFIPTELHGRLVILALVCYSGDIADGPAVLAPFRALAEPLADLVRPIPYPELFMPDDPDYHPSVVSRTTFIDALDHDHAAAIVGLLEAFEPSMRAVQLRVLGGAVSRVPADATAYAHRSARILVYVLAVYDGPEDRTVWSGWADDMVGLLDQGNAGAYVNFLGDEGQDGVRAAYPGATWDRLAAIKATYDPTNLFQRNQNVPPSAPDAGPPA